MSANLAIFAYLWTPFCRFTVRLSFWLCIFVLAVFVSKDLTIKHEQFSFSSPKYVFVERDMAV